MSPRRRVLLDDETLVVTVPLVRTTVRRPLAALVLVLSVVVAFTTLVRPLHTARVPAVVVTALPFLAVLGVRAARHRAHRIHVTSHRVIEVAGLWRRSMTSVALVAVERVEVRQGLSGRLLRRGTVVVVAQSGSVAFGPLRRPDALGRVIERGRDRRLAALPRVSPSWASSGDGPTPSLSVVEFDRRWRRAAHENEVTP